MVAAQLGGCDHNGITHHAHWVPPDAGHALKPSALFDHKLLMEHFAFDPRRLLHDDAGSADDTPDLSENNKFICRDVADDGSGSADGQARAVNVAINLPVHMDVAVASQIAFDI